MTNHYDALIGAHPARSLGDVLATLTRLRREFDLDDEELQSRGTQARLVMHTRLELFDALAEYVRPGAEREVLTEDRAADKGPRLALDQPKAWRG